MSSTEELNALTKVLNSYYTYEEFARKELLALRQIKWNSLTSEEQAHLPWFPQYLQTLEHCISINGDFTRNLALSVASEWGAPSEPSSWTKSGYADYDKVKSILKQLLREWSSEADDERDVVFKRVFEYVEAKYPDIEKRQDIKVLVPGVGLGRMNLEFVRRGFWCQGNEITYHMLLASNYILNHSYSKDHFTIFPFIHNFSNQVNRDLQTRPIFVPNVHSQETLIEVQKQYPNIPVGELMSVTSGPFTDLYGPEGLSLSDSYSIEPSAVEFRKATENVFDVLVTSYFLDTSTNIIDYLKTIHHALKKDGTWINFGPLLWHFEDNIDVSIITRPDGTKAQAPSQGLELTRDDLVELVNNWFEIQYRESEIEAGYGSDARGLGGWKYKCEYWIATPREAPIVD